MNIDDLYIRFKKYDPIKNIAIVNVVVCKTIEIRGFIVRYATLKNPPYSSMWIVSPPSVTNKKYKSTFWIVHILKPELWQELKEEIIKTVIAKTNIK